MPPIELAKTEIEGLDRLLGGGIPIPCALSIIGEVGSGKSILARQITWHLLNSGFACLYYSVDETAEDVRQSFESLGWAIDAFEEKLQLQFADVFSGGVELVGEKLANVPSEIVTHAYNLPDLIIKGRNFAVESQSKGYKNFFVVFDSLTPLFAMADKRQVFEFAQTMKFATRFFGAVGVAILHSGVVDQQTEDTVRHLSDCVVELIFSNSEKTQRAVRVLKLPHAGASLTPVAISNKGLTLYLPPT